MHALEGFLVIDFSRHVSGRSASLRLADLGARVINITLAGTGDAQGRHDASGLLMNGASSGFDAYNRNTESFAANLKNEADQNAVFELLKQADVVMHHFRPGVVEKLGLGYERVKALNERVVYGEISGYGTEGPWKDMPDDDLLVQSLSGLTWLSGNAGSGPVPMGLPVAGLLAGAHLVQGILACLVRRGISGEGGLVQVSLMESALDLQFEVMTTFYNDGGMLPERTEMNNAHAYLGAPYGIYQTNNGYIALAMGSVPVLGTLLQCPGLLAYQDVLLAFSKRDEIKAILSRHLRTGDTGKWLAVLEPADIWCADVLSWDTLMQHGGFKALDMLQEVEMPDGTYTTTRCPVRIDGEMLTSGKDSPKPEADDEDIAGELIRTTAFIKVL